MLFIRTSFYASMLLSFKTNYLVAQALETFEKKDENTDKIVKLKGYYYWKCLYDIDNTNDGGEFDEEVEIKRVRKYDRK